MRGGIIVIGSLFWDATPDRKIWWHELDFTNKRKIKLPIRYGRTSMVNRKGAYTMVFSKNFEIRNKLGNGYILPIKNLITTSREFSEQISLLAKAEGFGKGRICADWGTVCLKINSNLPEERKNALMQWWNLIVEEQIATSTANQRTPEISSFGVGDESKSITENWLLNLSDQVFETANDFDFLLATSNAVKHRNTDEIIYPSRNEIAKAIVDKKHIAYFLNNRKNGITTFDDKVIAKILKMRYRVELKRNTWS